jgi:hypothetical protein
MTSSENSGRKANSLNSMKSESIFFYMTANTLMLAPVSRAMTDFLSEIKGDSVVYGWQLTCRYLRFRI